MEDTPLQGPWFDSGTQWQNPVTPPLPIDGPWVQHLQELLGALSDPQAGTDTVLNQIVEESGQDPIFSSDLLSSWSPIHHVNRPTTLNSEPCEDLGAQSSLGPIARETHALAPPDAHAIVQGLPSDHLISAATLPSPHTHTPVYIQSLPGFITDNTYPQAPPNAHADHHLPDHPILDHRVPDHPVPAAIAPYTATFWKPHTSVYAQNSPGSVASNAHPPAFPDACANVLPNSLVSPVTSPYAPVSWDPILDSSFSTTSDVSSRAHTMSHLEPASRLEAPDRTHLTFPVTVHILTIPLNGPPNIETHALVPLSLSERHLMNDIYGRSSIRDIPLHFVAASVLISNNSTFKDMMSSVHHDCLLLHTLTRVPEVGEDVRTLASFFHAGQNYRQLSDWSPLTQATALQLQPLDTQYHPPTYFFVYSREAALPPALRGATHFLLILEEIRRPTTPRVLPAQPGHSPLSHPDSSQSCTPGFFNAAQPNLSRSPSIRSDWPPSQSPSPPPLRTAYFQQHPLPPRSSLVRTLACRTTNTPAGLNIDLEHLSEIWNIMEIDRGKYRPYTDLPMHERTPTIILNSLERAYDFLYRLGGFKSTQMKNILDGCDYILKDGTKMTTKDLLERVLGWSGTGDTERNYTDREQNFRWAESCSRISWREELGTAHELYDVHQKIVAFFAWRRQGHKRTPDPDSQDAQERLASGLLLGHCQNNKKAMKRMLINTQWD
ncbi:hypothetical protein PM082_021948 [Marasmius tenuissimus]|nr:hypothetical protein PM082_021948 [Marasmius tenuissimus]